MRIYFDPDPAAAPATGGDPPVASWRDSLPDDLKADPSLKDIADVGTLAKSYVHAQKAVGNNVAIPGKTATPEELSAFYQKLGRPEAPDKYDFGKDPDDLAFKANDEVKSNYMKKAHEAGLSNRQASQLYQWYMGNMSSAAKSHEQQLKQTYDEGVKSLKTEWGDAFDQNVDLARAAVAEFGGEELQKLLDDTGLGNDARVIKAMANVGRGMTEDRLHTQGRNASFKHTPAEASAMIAQKQTDPEFMKAYQNNDHPGHAGAVAAMQELFAAKNSGA